MMKDIPNLEIFNMDNVKTSRFGIQIGGFPNLDVHDLGHSNILIWYTKIPYDPH